MSGFVRRSAAAVALTAALAIVPSAAAAPSTAELGSLTAARDWMTRAQMVDGGMPFCCVRSDLLLSLEWSVLGLAAANRNAQDVAVPGGRTLWVAVADNLLWVNDTADLARYLLAAHAVGVDPHAVGEGKVDLVQAILKDELDTGGLPPRAGALAPDANATAWAALALSVVNEPAARDATDRADDWLLANQNANGSWPGDLGAGRPADVETTALALEALAARRGFSNPAAALASSRALGWLQLRQNPDGGFGNGGPGDPSNAWATAAVVRATIATGNDPHQLGHDPLQYLRSLQDTGTGLDRARVSYKLGEVGVSPGPTVNTGYAMLAWAGITLPFGPVAHGGGDANLPAQTVPDGLPTGPLLPVEVAPPASAPTQTPPPAPPRTVTAPRIVAPIEPPAEDDEGVAIVRRKPASKREPPNLGSGIPDDGTGDGDGGTIATPGAPDRPGGGGGAGGGAPVAPAPASGTPAQATPKPGGTKTRTGDEELDVTGKLLGEQSDTRGAAGDRGKAPGELGSQAGHRTAWWAIVLGLILAGAVGAGIALDRRRPELVL